MNNLLNTKASVTDMNSKASVTDMITRLDAKASTASLNTKASITDMNAQLNLKATVSDMNNLLNTKANTTDLNVYKALVQVTVSDIESTLGSNTTTIREAERDIVLIEDKTLANTSLINALENSQKILITANTNKCVSLANDIAYSNTIQQTNSTSISNNATSIMANTLLQTNTTSEVFGLFDQVFSLMDDYPSVAITGFGAPSLSATSLFGAITVVGSSMDTSSNYSPYQAFNKVANGSSTPWKSNANFHKPTLNFGAQTYQTRVDNVMTGKQWIYIDCLIPQTFSGFKMHFLTNNMNDRPKEYHIAGSTNNVNFTSLFYTSNEQYTGNSVSHSLSTGSYRYYRLVINDIVSVDDNLNHSAHVEELSFYKLKPEPAYVSQADFDTLLIMAQETKSDLNRFISVFNSLLATGKIFTVGLNLFGDITRLLW
jgi:hypothetical protein